MHRTTDLLANTVAKFASEITALTDRVQDLQCDLDEAHIAKERFRKERDDARPTLESIRSQLSSTEIDTVVRHLHTIVHARKVADGNDANTTYRIATIKLLRTLTKLSLADAVALTDPTFAGEK